MLAPMRARLESSFSKKGIQAVATATTCLGETSMKSTLSASTSILLPRVRAITVSPENLLSSVNGELAWATM